jgi:spore germination protein YaaH
MMVWVWRALLLALLVIQPLAQGQPLKAMGYLGWWLPDSWRSLPLQEFDRLFFFELKVDATGTIAERHGWPEEWNALQSATAQRQVPLDLTLTLFDAATFNALFSSTSAVERLLKESLELANTPLVAGLHLDFEIYEGASTQALGQYRAFLKTLADQLHAMTPAKSLSVFIQAGGNPALYDANTLTAIDFVVVQGYDAHYPGSKTAGPVAPLSGPDMLTWQKAAASNLALGVPKDRMVFAFPLYGYEWLVKDGKPRSIVKAEGATTTFAAVSADLLPRVQTNVTQRVQRYGAVHDASTGSAYYKFKNDLGKWTEGWFEDWWSLGQKFDFLNQEQLGGVAFFMLGYDQDELVRYYLQRRGPKSIETLIEQIQR